MLITVTHSLVGNALHNILSTAFNRIISHVLEHGDGLLDHGGFSWTEANAVASQPSGGTDAGASSSGGTAGSLAPGQLAVHVCNANNHQVTYGVLGAVLSSMIEFMQANGWGTATFEIWDGPNLVGGGVLG